MIVYTIYYKESGEILATGICQNIEDIQEYINDSTDIVYEQSYPNQYVEYKKIVSMPTKPDGYYKFDYITKQWVFDSVAADLAAKRKRDVLLAEGPDRISPLWWNSMTPLQQQEWEYYRQALLDITEQADYPEFIVWPIKP